MATQGYQTAGEAPGMVKASTGNGGGFSLLDISQHNKPLPVQMQSVSKDAINAGRVAARAQLEAADIIASTMQQLGQQTGQLTESIQREADASRAAELAKQQREQEFAAITRDKYELTVGDLSDPEAVGNQMAARIAETAKERMALGDEIRRKQSIGFMDNPLGWLEAQLSMSGLVSQYNTLADVQNGMQADAQGLLQVSNNMADAQKAGIPAHTLEENHAAIVQIEEAAAKKKLEAEMQLQVNKNIAAKSTAQLMQENYSTLMGLDDRRRQVELNNINQLQEATKWDAARQTRLYQEMRASQANAATLSVRRMEVAMGLQEGTGNALLDDQSIPKESRDLLMRYAFTGSIESPEQAVVISRYANRGRDEAGKPIADAGIVKMTDKIVRAQQKFYNDATERAGKGVKISDSDWKKMPDAEKSMEFSKHLRTYIHEDMKQEAVGLTPAELAARVQPGTIEAAFPELTMYVQGGAAMQVTNEGIATAFMTAAKGDTLTAAKRLAAYNRVKLATVVGSTPLEQAGIEAPKNLIKPAAYPSTSAFGIGGTPDSMAVDWTSVASIERYLRIREAAKKNPYANLAQYKE